MLKTPIPFGAQFSPEAQSFGLAETLAGRGAFWEDVLQTHDTYGVPFDLIWLKVKETVSMPLTSEQFVEFMKMIRYGLETYGPAGTRGISHV